MTESHCQVAVNEPKPSTESFVKALTQIASHFDTGNVLSTNQNAEFVHNPALTCNC